MQNFQSLFCFSGKKMHDFLIWKLSGRHNVIYLIVRKCRIHFNFKRRKACVNAERELFMLYFLTNVHGFDSYERLSE